MNGGIHGFAEEFVVDDGFALLFPGHLCQVHGTEVAGFIGQERLFAAGVGGFDLADGRHDVVAVQAVDEDDARFAVAPGGVDDLAENFTGVETARHFFGAGVDEVVFFILFGGGHEFFGESHGNIEVGNGFIFGFAVDKFQNIGMIHPKDAHIGAAAGAALFYRFGGGVEHLHKADGARSHTAGGFYNAPFGTQTGKGKPGAAAGFMDQSGVFDGIEDAFHGIFHRQNEAGGKLTQFFAGVHQRRRIGQKAHGGHQFVKFFFGRCDIGVAVVIAVFGGKSAGNPSEEAFRRFDDIVLFITGQITPFQYDTGVFI